jgi:hypothetical protein
MVFFLAQFHAALQRFNLSDGVGWNRKTATDMDSWMEGGPGGSWRLDRCALCKWRVLTLLFLNFGAVLLHLFLGLA